jgi:hypothetical protein
MNDVFLKSRAVERLCPEKMFVYRDGIFEWNDEGEPPTEAEIDAEVVAFKVDYYYEELRKKRNQLLAETDYLALADVTLTDEMRAYRQALRDLPANTTDPANPVWPTKPE